ncbi:hypothetical protein IFM89_033888 [Coptis chinensis]|uniref:5' exonuclease Apollo n=1 Tax=Coptis chinensis TaxID=261450 RepID=A0A835LFB1_9MAGN|nr:hypothetical protein IFM89_033888 [Coptis chinensis]
MEKGIISVDKWTESSQAYFLTHLHSDHTKGLSSNWNKGPLFCSSITAKLFPSKFPDFKSSLLIKVLEIGSHYSISLFSPSSGAEITVQVMAIDADHCPGAVMYLFRGEFGCVLYTGDFRWEGISEKALLGKSMLLNALGSDRIDVLYLDNTYCNPSYSFPPREVVAQQIRVWPERLQTMHLLGFRDIFTTTICHTRVRAVPFYSFSINILEELNKMHPTIGIMPSGLPWVVRPSKRIAALLVLPILISTIEARLQTQVILLIEVSRWKCQALLESFITAYIQYRTQITCASMNYKSL